MESELPGDELLSDRCVATWLGGGPRYSSALLLCIAVIPSIMEILCSYSV
jgi:hypothetical protein